MVETVESVPILNKDGLQARDKKGWAKMEKVVKEKQLTVIWHVDDLMASCEDDIELTKFAFYLAKICRPKPVIHTGPKHDYLRMDLEFLPEGTLEVSMFQYLDSVIREFPETISGKATSPAVDHLFKIREGEHDKH